MNFDELARQYRRDALEAELMASYERELLNHIDISRPAIVLSSDTTIAEMYDDPWSCLVWFRGAHQYWLKKNFEFIEKAKNQIYYRYIFVPHPCFQKNLQKRRILVELIQLHLHLHLWHGVVTGVVFVDPRRNNIKGLIRDLNFVSVPRHQLFFESRDFFREQDIIFNKLFDNIATKKYTSIISSIAQQKLSPIWLYYNETNFSRDRITGWRWQTLREFFSKLYGPKISCYYCSRENTETFALDHIAPISHGYYQTLLNFRPLCKSCNSGKGAIIGDNPYKLRLLFPQDLDTVELNRILSEPPSWLGNIVSPTSRREIERSLIVNI